MKKYLFLFIISCGFMVGAKAQYTQIGNKFFASGNLGPIMTDTLPAFYSRFAFIYPQASLTNLRNNDSIFALGFDHFSFDSLRGNTNIKIYIKPTTQSDFGVGNLNWLAETRNGMTLVYDGDGKEEIGYGPKKAVFVFNEVAGYQWDSTQGTNLEILIQYTQTTNQVNRFPWYVETSASVPAFVNNNEVKYVFGSSTSGLDSITDRSSRTKPTLRIYHPDVAEDLEVARIYSLGRVPLLMKRADSIKVVVENVGKREINNAKFYLNVSGSNTFLDSLTVPSLAPFAEQFIYFDTYMPANQGTETIEVEAAVDSNLLNSRVTKDRIVTYSNYSHTDPFLGNTGGIGFNNSTGDFLAKYYVEGTSYINQIKLDFNGTGDPFQLGLWEEGPNGLPGNEIFMSDTLTSNGGTFIQPVLPRVQVSGGYFVGIRQTSGANVAFSYQTEAPIRPNTFYFAAPAGDTDWVGFSPGFNFNFNIQPRLQVANDVAVFRISTPGADDSIQYSVTDSITPQVTLFNFGFSDQSGFITRLVIKNRFNQEIYNDGKPVSVTSGDSTVVTFEKLSKFNLGEFTAEASIALNIDSVTDNNTLENTFFFIKNYDVGVDRIFSPRSGDTIELNRERYAPTVRVANYGVIGQTNLLVHAELVNSKDSILSSALSTVDIGPGTSTILQLDSMDATQVGTHTLRVYTQTLQDSFPINDTAKITLICVKVNDIVMQRVNEPSANEIFAKGATLRPFAVYFNEGLQDEVDVPIIAIIRGIDGSILYSDTVLKTIAAFSNGQALFADRVLDSLGDYTLEARALLPTDQVRENDVIINSFSVVTANDLQLKEILAPMQAVIPVNASPIEPQLVIANRGFVNLTNVPLRIYVIDNQNDTTYRDVVTASLPSLAQDTVRFKLLDFNSLGDYNVVVINENVGESERNGTDTLLSSYITRYTDDLAIVEENVPVTNFFLENNVEITPSVIVQNLGLDTVRGRSITMTIKDEDNNVLWADIVPLDPLSYPFKDVVVASKSWSTTIDGNYTIEYTCASQDNNTSNDTLVVPFEVGRTEDAAALSIDFPADGDELYKTYLYKPVVKVENRGKSALKDVEVRLAVEVAGAVIYQDVVNVDLAVDEVVELEMDSLLTYSTIASATAKLSVQAGDLYLDNDEIITNFSFVTGLGVRDALSEGVSVYPVPFTHTIHIDTEKEVRSARLININGQEVWKTNDASAKVLNINDEIAAGVYTLLLETEEGMLQVQVIRK